MNKKRCIIIDDERLARVILRDMITGMPSIEILNECANAASAKISIEEHRPDFILLDIRMPDKTGFELLEDLDYIPQVIFTTAYDEHALQAFKVNALDYLLKPIKEDDLHNALNKIVVSPTNDASIKPLPDQLFIKDGDACHFIKLIDIIQFTSFGNYVKVITSTESVLAKRSLNDIEKRTVDNKFFRANRTVLLNLEKVKDVHMSMKGKIKVILQNEEEVVLSERKSVRFRELMGL